MKIYNHTPIKVVRLSIQKSEEKTLYINFIETTQEEVIEKLSNLIDSLNLSVLCKGDRVRLDTRDCIGGKNGKNKSISFIGLTVAEIHEKIIQKFS